MTRDMTLRGAVRRAAAALSVAMVAGGAVAQSSTDDIASRAADPTRSPLSLQFYDYYSPNVYGLPGSINQLVFRPVIPYKAFGVDNILRLTFTQTTRAPGGRTGFNDLQFLQLSIVEQWGGRVAFGLSGSLPVGADAVSSDRYTLGPSFGYVTNTAGGLLYGALVQSFFSVGGSSSAAHVGQINIQPVMALPLGEGRTLSLGSAGVLYDIERARWASIMPSLQYSWVTKLGGLNLRPQAEVSYELRDLTGNPKTTFRLGVQVLL